LESGAEQTEEVAPSESNAKAFDASGLASVESTLHELKESIQRVDRKKIRYRNFEKFNG